MLIFYFSGHGCVLNNGEFGLCLKDTQVRQDTEAILSLSVLGFSDLMQTVAAADVHPIVIIDACYSGTVAGERLLAAMHDNMHRDAGSSYAILASCHGDRLSKDTHLGGEFTKVLLDVARAGLADDVNKRRAELRLPDIIGSLQEAVQRAGIPLPKFYLGPDLPRIPFIRNVAHEPLDERFTWYHRDIILFMWNNGRPREVTITEIDEHLGKSAYGNHNKLRLAPWALVEEGDKSRSRRLTSAGELFAQGKSRIPELLRKDPDTGTFRAAPESKVIAIGDVVSPGKRSVRKPNRAKP